MSLPLVEHPNTKPVVSTANPEFTIVVEFENFGIWFTVPPGVVTVFWQRDGMVESNTAKSVVSGILLICFILISCFKVHFSETSGDAPSTRGVPG